MLAAGAAGYAIGTGLLKAWQYLKPEERDYRKAQAIKKARQEWEAKKGRAMTRAEVQAFYKGFNDSLAIKRM